MVESIYFLKPAWCGTHLAGLWPEQGLQPVTRATALRRWFVTPLTGAWRQMTHLRGEAGFVGETLQRDFPQAHTIAIAATTICRDQKAPGFGVQRLAHPFPPAADAFDGELRRVMVDAHTYPALAGGKIIDAAGRGFAKHRVDKIVYPYFHRTAFLLPFLARVPEVADQFLFLGIHTDHRLSCFNRRLYLRVEVMELRIPIRMVCSLTRLADTLQTVALLCQQIADGTLRDRVSDLRQLPSQLRRALARPAQTGLRIAPRHRIHQPIQGIT